MALKDFDYSSSLGYKWPITSKSKGLKLHDCILSFLLLSRTDIGLTHNVRY